MHFRQSKRPENPKFRQPHSFQTHSPSQATHRTTYPYQVLPRQGQQRGADPQRHEHADDLGGGRGQHLSLYKHEMAAGPEGVQV